MIGRHRISLLSQALLILGVAPMADAVARMAEREERELAEVTRDLAAAGLDAEQIKLAFGESEFVNRARLCLEVDHIMRASGQGGETSTVISMARDLLGPERPIVSFTTPPAATASLLEVSGRRGPGRQLRDERERVGEPLRVLAAYAGLTAVELGEIERGVRVPTAEEWAALQVALPDLGPMEAPPTEAERSPVVRARSEVADLILHTRLLHPAGDVDLTVSRPSLAWRVWSAQRQAAQVASEDDSRVGAELTRMLPPEPERGSMDVLRVRIPASPLGAPRWLAEPEVQDIGYRHLHTLAEAAYALGGAAGLGSLFGLVRELGDHMRADLFATAGIVMSQAIDGNGRVITLDMWGQAQLDIHLLSCSQDEPLDYVDTGIWTRTDRREFLRQLATPAFVERIVDRLMSWAGMTLERACKTAELALAEVDAAAAVRPSTSADSSWSVEVIRPAPTTGPIASRRPAQDEPTFSSET